MVFSKKCRGCSEKVDRKFNYCPWCGASLKVKSDMGLLGDNDFGKINPEVKLPFGVEKIMGSLVKQLEKQLEGMNMENMEGMPKGFKIQIGRAPQQGRVVMNQPEIRKQIIVSPEENKRRANLKKVDAASRVKRLGDVIVYEIEAPGVSSEKDVVVTELEAGIEVRAYTKEKCYVKVIPLKVEVLGTRVEKERVFVELKGN